MLGEPGRYIVTFFTPEDVPHIADLLAKSARDAAKMAPMLNLISSFGPITPNAVTGEDDILAYVRAAPWPPTD